MMKKDGDGGRKNANIDTFNVNDMESTLDEISAIQKSQEDGMTMLSSDVNKKLENLISMVTSIAHSQNTSGNPVKLPVKSKVFGTTTARKDMLRKQLSHTREKPKVSIEEDDDST